MKGKGIYRKRHRFQPRIRKFFVVPSVVVAPTVQVPIWPHIVRMATARIRRM